MSDDRFIDEVKGAVAGTKTMVKQTTKAYYEGVTMKLLCLLLGHNFKLGNGDNFCIRVCKRCRRKEGFNGKVWIHFHKRYMTEPWGEED